MHGQLQQWVSVSKKWLGSWKENNSDQTSPLSQLWAGSNFDYSAQTDRDQQIPLSFCCSRTQNLGLKTIKIKHNFYVLNSGKWKDGPQADMWVFLFWKMIYFEIFNLLKKQDKWWPNKTKYFIPQKMELL